MSVCKTISECTRQEKWSATQNVKMVQAIVLVSSPFRPALERLECSRRQQMRRLETRLLCDVRNHMLKRLLRTGLELRDRLPNQRNFIWPRQRIRHGALGAEFNGTTKSLPGLQNMGLPTACIMGHAHVEHRGLSQVSLFALEEAPC